MMRILKKLVLCFQQNSILHSKRNRPMLLRLSGVKVGKHVHIGEHVLIDTMFPENITIGDNTTITMRCTILTHYYKPNSKSKRYFSGKVNIGKRVFMGCHSVICAPVNIGDDAVIAAGAVITKDIPHGEIWGGYQPSLLQKGHLLTLGA